MKKVIVDTPQGRFIFGKGWIQAPWRDGPFEIKLTKEQAEQIKKLNE